MIDLALWVSPCTSFLEFKVQKSQLIIIMSSLRLAMTSLLTGLRPEVVEKLQSDKTGFPQKQHVFHASDVPKWMQWDPFIQRGYRTQLNSFKRCFWSLFYLHNESINTWSHVLAGIYFLAVLLATDYWIAQLGLKVPLSDILAIQTYVAGTAGCLIFSVSLSVNQSFLQNPEVLN